MLTPACLHPDSEGHFLRLVQRRKTVLTIGITSSMLSTRPGRPQPLGATINPNGVNFSLFSQNATRVELLLFDHQALRHDPGKCCHRQPDAAYRFG